MPTVALKSGTRLMLAAFALCALSASANASFLYKTGFEHPPFTIGNIAGQDGWGSFGPANESQIENAAGFVETGSQALGILQGDGTFQTGAYKAVTTAAPSIEQTGDILLSSGGTPSRWEFGATGPGLSGLIGGIRVDSDGTIHAIGPGFPVIGSLSRGSFHHVELFFNFVGQVQTIFIDGTKLINNDPFCGSIGIGGCTHAPVAAYGDGIFDRFPVTPFAEDVGALDNYSVEAEGVVTAAPEPSTLLLLSAALIGVGATRRNQRSRSESVGA